MATPKYEPTEELYKLARESGERGGAWCAFANRAKIDRVTADKYYRDTWLEAKDTEVMHWGKEFSNMLTLITEEAKEKELPERIQAIKEIGGYLTKCNPEWSIKQQIEQTNVNVEVPSTMDYSKLSEEDKDTLIRIRLKAKG